MSLHSIAQLITNKRRLCCLQGFLVNRVLIPMINEAFYCLMEVSTNY
jgi:3-hydroxyacyl-CoA dehydrogenase